MELSKIREYMNEEWFTEIMVARIDFEDEDDLFYNFTIMNLDDEGEECLLLSKN